MLFDLPRPHIRRRCVLPSAFSVPASFAPIIGCWRRIGFVPQTFAGGKDAKQRRYSDRTGHSSTAQVPHVRKMTPPIGALIAWIKRATKTHSEDKEDGKHQVNLNDTKQERLREIRELCASSIKLLFALLRLLL